jgi:hypothetical protein
MLWKRMGEWMNWFTYSWPWHELEVSGQLRVLAALSLGKIPPGTHLIVWVGPRTGLNHIGKKKFLILPGLESDLLDIQPIASRYTDYAILAPY